RPGRQASLQPGQAAARPLRQGDRRQRDLEPRGVQLRRRCVVHPGGEEMTEQDWDAGFAQSLTVFLNGSITESDRRGQPVRDDSFLLLFNASPRELEFTLPPARYGEVWETVLDTARPDEWFEDDAAAKAGGLLPMRDRSVQVLRRR